MQAQRCVSVFQGGQSGDPAADIASHRLDFLAARLEGTENPQNDQ
jgi:hypothetical protein